MTEFPDSHKNQGPELGVGLVVHRCEKALVLTYVYFFVQKDFSQFVFATEAVWGAVYILNLKPCNALL